MNSSLVWSALRAGVLLCPAFLATTVVAQSVEQAILLELINRQARQPSRSKREKRRLPTRPRTSTAFLPRG